MLEDEISYWGPAYFQGRLPVSFREGFSREKPDSNFWNSSLEVGFPFQNAASQRGGAVSPLSEGLSEE